ncbi:MAG: DUF1501 domain-containing protein, partial [Acidobacteria bacterium]|nr:DUF1501 domain-containing protein [Acidobacteriota bacterium]
MERREFLRSCGCAVDYGLYPALALAAKLHNGHPLAPRPAHFEPKAKRLILIYLTGGFSHVDTFDPKPRLQSDQGKQVSAESLRSTQTRPLLASPFEFRPSGESGLMISDLFRRLRTV